MNSFAEDFTNPPAKEEKPWLLLIGGITPENYILNDLVYSKHFPQEKYDLKRMHTDSNASLTIYGKEDAKYYAIKEINCERFFDSTLMTFCSKLFLLGIPFKVWDRFGDFFKVAFSKEEMSIARSEIIHEYQSIRAKYGVEAHFLTHSLGTWLLAGTGLELEKTIMTGSPISSCSALLRNIIQDELKQSKLITTKELIYVFSQRDLVCTSPLPTGFTFGSEKLSVLSSEGSHKYTEYSDCLINKELLIL